MSVLGLILNISDATAIKLQATGAKAVTSEIAEQLLLQTARGCGAHTVLDLSLRTWTNIHFRNPVSIGHILVAVFSSKEWKKKLFQEKLAAFLISYF